MLLGALQIVAVWYDLRERRIPNSLIVVGTLSALLLQVLVLAGAGVASEGPNSFGLSGTLTGLAIGTLALLPFYLVGAAGAGDVKLMAMTGAFLGPQNALGATLGTFLMGGLLALHWYRAQSPQRGTLQRARIPYAPAIALGTVLWLCGKHAL